MRSQELTLEGLVADIAGEEIVRDRVSGSPLAAEEIGAQLGTRLLELGATRLLAQVS